MVESPILFYRSDRPFGFLSNLYKSEITLGDMTFPTAEHAYQYPKAKDLKVRAWIMEAPKPHLVAAISHALLSYDIIPNWSKIKVSRMKAVLKAKFTQHEDLKQKLLDTGHKALIENSKTDGFWGIGRKGDGKNTLGRLLMELRRELRGEKINLKMCKAIDCHCLVYNEISGEPYCVGTGEKCPYQTGEMDRELEKGGFDLEELRGEQNG